MRLTKEELKVVIFAVQSDLEVLDESIKQSEADDDWKRDYTILQSALEKLKHETGW